MIGLLDVVTITTFMTGVAETGCVSVPRAASVKTGPVEGRDWCAQNTMKVKFTVSRVLTTALSK